MHQYLILCSSHTLKHPICAWNGPVCSVIKPHHQKMLPLMNSHSRVITIHTPPPNVHFYIYLFRAQGSDSWYLSVTVYVAQTPEP